MDVRSTLKVLGGVLTVPFLISLPIQAKNPNPEVNTILAGPIGKSSSASARVTLIIPPRPKNKQVTSQKVNNESKNVETNIKNERVDISKELESKQ